MNIIVHIFLKSNGQIIVDSFLKGLKKNIGISPIVSEKKIPMSSPSYFSFKRLHIACLRQGETSQQI